MKSGDYFIDRRYLAIYDAPPSSDIYVQVHIGESIIPRRLLRLLVQRKRRHFSQLTA